TTRASMLSFDTLAIIPLPQHLFLYATSQNTGVEISKHAQRSLPFFTLFSPHIPRHVFILQHCTGI
ncbi:hypothetical protein BX661DRAFT_182426, partial [Kickxella alabastrina]|uniref:uncharacterized protein n=1 Tax=Kickxella alabastrina TaxID=61397 RepID=UPI00222087FE